MKREGLGFLVWLAFLAAATAHSQTYKTLLTFDGTDGAKPFAPLVQGADGRLYGTTAGEELDEGGTVFKTTTGGGFENLNNFNGTDGYTPFGGLVQAADGSFYGTTYDGGSAGGGTAFKITSAGKVTLLHTFCQGSCTDGIHPVPGLTMTNDGQFYGTTMSTAFKMSPDGTVTTLHTFQEPDGAVPEGGLVRGVDGNFYGTTYEGGNVNSNCFSYYGVGCGTVFLITPEGKFTQLYLFCSLSYCADGSNPVGTLIQGSDGEFYGTTSGGGDTSVCEGGCGTVFKISSEGVLTTLYTFCTQPGCTDGWDPNGTLVEATNGDYYGTALLGGQNVGDCSGYGPGCGVVFKITSTGRFSTVYTFSPDGGGIVGPWAGVIQFTDGNFYGTTIAGGEGYGGVFKLSVGLRPFVATQPTYGKPGLNVIILGTSLAGASVVSFNGAAADFTVVSKSEITTTVPSGATTGKVQVTVPGGTLVSNVDFRVQE
jgi:uncharacterized repeat protein (TIGR03803 family)